MATACKYLGDDLGPLSVSLHKAVVGRNDGMEGAFGVSLVGVKQFLGSQGAWLGIAAAAMTIVRAAAVGRTRA